MPSLIRFTTALPARSASARLARDTASWAELFPRLMPECFDRRSHRVRRVHAAATTRPWNRGALHLRELLVVDLAGGMGTDRFEHRHDVALLFARADRAAVNEHGRPIEARDCHHAPGHVLVAAAERDKAVESLRTHGCLDRVGDHLARNERITHPRCSHRNAVGDRDRAECRALATRRVSAFRCGNREFVDVRVARREVAPRRGNPDLRLAEVAILRSPRRAAWPGSPSA